MNEIDVLEILLTEIEDLGYGVETRFGLQDHEPETVIIDGWDSDRKIRANDTRHSIARDSNGNAIGENHHFYTEMDIELQVHGEDELYVMNVRNDIVNHFRQYEGSPRNFHDDTVIFKVTSGGLTEPMFEPTSLRVHKAAQGFYVEFVDRDVLAEDVEELEEIETDYEIT